MLKGQAKTDYQREYMRRYRAKNKDSLLLSRKQGLENAPESPRMDERQSVRPKVPSVRPDVRPLEPKSQSYNPMMEGYVPPR